MIADDKKTVTNKTMFLSTNLHESELLSEGQQKHIRLPPNNRKPPKSFVGYLTEVNKTYWKNCNQVSALHKAVNPA